MKLYDLRKTIEDNTVTISVSVDSETIGTKVLWFSTDRKYEEYICDNRYDAFLVGLLYPAMRYGEDIYIDGKTSKKLVFNTNHYTIPLIQSFSSVCEQIKITAKEVTSDTFGGKGVGTGFSGGVDSFCTIYDHYALEEDPEYKINSFLFLNVGSHGSDDEVKVKEKFQVRYEFLKKFPKEIGLEFIPIDSNLFEFHPWGHQLTHTLTSASGILMAQKLYHRYYYASSGINYEDAIKNAYTYKDLDIGAYCDPLLLPLVSTESLEILSDGVQYSRVEKTLRILEYEPVHRYLNVCISSEETHENCSVCNKCARTLMTINSVGKLDRVNRLFDIEKYKKMAERKYVGNQVALQSKDPFAKANVELAKVNNVKLPNRSWCVLVLAANNMKRTIKNAVKARLSEATVARLKKIRR